MKLTKEPAGPTPPGRPGKPGAPCEDIKHLRLTKVLDSWQPLFECNSPPDPESLCLPSDQLHQQVPKNEDHHTHKESWCCLDRLDFLFSKCVPEFPSFQALPEVQLVPPHPSNHAHRDHPWHLADPQAPGSRHGAVLVSALNETLYTVRQKLSH